MIRTVALIEEQQHETSFIEAGPSSSQNPVAITAAIDSIVRVSSSDDDDDEWSSSDDDEKQVAEIRSRAPTENGVKIVNEYTECTGVSSTVNSTNIYEDGVTVNQNFYCCCPASYEHVLKTYVAGRRGLFVLILLLGISLIISLSLRISNLNKPKLPYHIETETTSIVSTLTERSESTIFTTPPTVLSQITTQDISEFNFTATDGWKIIGRNEWGATSPNHEVGKLTSLPPTYVILSETGTESCTTTQKCTRLVRDIQTSHLASFLKPDILYSFLVGGDGMVYEGRGWDVHAVGNYDTEYFDHTSISVAFIGNFGVAVPTETILQAAKTLLWFGVQSGKLAEDYRLKCLGQLSRTIKNPGDKLYDVIATWKEWDNRTIDSFPAAESYGS